MPLWLLLLGGGAVVWWLASRQAVSVPVPSGASQYRVDSSGADYWTSDPSLGSGQTGVAPAKAGTLAAGTPVYATTPAGAAPTLSSDSAYELILAPGIGQVWVGIASIVAQ